MNKYELLKKFIQNNCNEEEAEKAMQYLEAEPWLLDEVLNKSEWDEMPDIPSIPPAVESEMRKHVFSKTSRPILRLLKPVLASAAIVSALAIGLFFLNDSNRKDIKALSANKAVSTTSIISNHTTAVKIFTLDDNSTVTLYPGSSIEYAKAFISKRTVTLKGKATFHVTKNAGSPFVVYTGSISTTALGTRFLVDNSNDINNVTVKLFEGRVVIRPVGENQLIQETFLLAGQQCFVDIRNHLVKVKPLFTGEQTAAKRTASIQRINNSQAKENVQLQFTKTPMPEVLEKLQAAFKTRIAFNLEDLKENYFTGSFSPKDSLSTILKMISQMSELKVSDDSAIIRIEKSPEKIQPTAKIQVEKIIDSSYTAFSPGKIDPQKIVPKADPASHMLTTMEVKAKMPASEEETMFTSISLPALFEELQKQSKKKIHFDSVALKNINFTGSVPKNMHIRDVLSLICNSNGLTLKVRKGSYFINKTEQ